MSGTLEETAKKFLVDPAYQKVRSFWMFNMWICLKPGSILSIILGVL